MRFAWLKKKLTNNVAVKQGFAHPFALIRKAYNAVFWIFLLPFLTTIDYSIGFLAFTLVIFVRFSLSLYTNNVLDLTPQQYERYPFRI